MSDIVNELEALTVSASAHPVPFNDCMSLWDCFLVVSVRKSQHRTRIAEEMGVMVLSLRPCRRSCAVPSRYKVSDTGAFYYVVTLTT